MESQCWRASVWALKSLSQERILQLLRIHGGSKDWIEIGSNFDPGFCFYWIERLNWNRIEFDIWNWLHDVFFLHPICLWFFIKLYISSICSLFSIFILFLLFTFVTTHNKNNFYSKIPVVKSFDPRSHGKFRSDHKSFCDRIEVRYKKIMPE